MWSGEDKSELLDGLRRFLPSSELQEPGFVLINGASPGVQLKLPFAFLRQGTN